MIMLIEHHKEEKMATQTSSKDMIEVATLILYKSIENEFILHSKEIQKKIYNLLKEKMKRIIKVLYLSRETIIASFIYFSRYSKKNKIKSENIENIFIISCIESLKMNEDRYWDNTDYYKLVESFCFEDLNELNILERQFLKSIDYNLFISKEFYEKFLFQFCNVKCK
jgi:hypothetical protein